MQGHYLDVVAPEWMRRVYALTAEAADAVGRTASVSNTMMRAFDREAGIAKLRVVDGG